MTKENTLKKLREGVRVVDEYGRVLWGFRDGNFFRATDITILDLPHEVTAEHILACVSFSNLTDFEHSPESLPTLSAVRVAQCCATCEHYGEFFTCKLRGHSYLRPFDTCGEYVWNES